MRHPAPRNIPSPARRTRTRRRAIVGCVCVSLSRVRPNRNECDGDLPVGRRVGWGMDAGIGTGQMKCERESLTGMKGKTNDEEPEEREAGTAAWHGSMLGPIRPGIGTCAEERERKQRSSHATSTHLSRSPSTRSRYCRQRHQLCNAGRDAADAPPCR